jgi:hypothetical protein
MLKYDLLDALKADLEIGCVWTDDRLKQPEAYCWGQDTSFKCNTMNNNNKNQQQQQQHKPST